MGAQGRRGGARLGAGFAGWADVDPARAAGYVGQLPYEPGHGYAAAVAAHWTESDPAAAAQWAAGLADPAARYEALWQVAQRWALTDAAAAARWAQTLPPSRNRTEIWRIISDHWADVDPAGVETWIGTLPTNNGDRDAAVIAYAARIVRTAPQKALTWAKSLADSAYATQQTEVLLAAWARQDAPAARNWAAANQIAFPPGR